MRRTVSLCLSLALCAMAAIALPAQTFTTLYNFCTLSGCLDGAYPDATLLQSIGGDLYSNTYVGGNGGAGTIYKITPSGVFTTVYQLCTPDGACPQSIEPTAPLIQAVNGTFYGTTGGVTPPSFGFAGAVFAMKDVQVDTLYTFCAQSGCADGANPNGLVQADNGDLYGTTIYGGECGYVFYCGTVFKITPSGTLTTLYDFCNNGGATCPDGLFPTTGLVQAANGGLYGATAQGGDHDYGTLFQITPSGTLTTLYSFCTYEAPMGLTLAPNGDLWGVTQNGATPCSYVIGAGTIFKLTPNGQFTTMYTFCQTGGTCLDGENPSAQLTLGSDGNFYGATALGGPLGVGTIFRITPDGALTTLYGATATTLIEDTDGDFYGTTSAGGANCLPAGCGTIFRLSVGLGPFVKTLPVAAKAGAVVRILGTDLTGTTSVAFNGATAVFRVVSSSEIITTVPEGASSGTVQVVTPGGALSSDLPFRVP